MSLSGKHLAHVLHSYAVYFVLRRPLERASFLEILSSLESRAGKADTAVTAEAHWNALLVRIAGLSRWDSVAPQYTGETKSVEGWRKLAATVQSIENIVRLRPFSGYTIEGLRYTVDVFNPANELELPYWKAGEPVLALLFQGLVREPGPISLRLLENEPFYEIVKDIERILSPEFVCGTYSMMSVLWAYLDGRVDPEYRPWEFLYPLHLLKGPSIPLTPETRIGGEAVGMMPGKSVKLARVEEWGDDRVLIQIRPGLDAIIGWEYFAVAKALGMVPVQQLMEGKAPPHPGHAEKKGKGRT